MIDKNQFRAIFYHNRWNHWSHNSSLNEEISGLVLQAALIKYTNAHKWYKTHPEIQKPQSTFKETFVKRDCIDGKLCKINRNAEAQVNKKYVHDWQLAFVLC